MVIYESLTGPRNALLHKLKEDPRVAKTWTHGARLKILLKPEVCARIAPDVLEANSTRGREAGERVVSVFHLEQLGKLVKLGWTQSEAYSLLYFARRKPMD